LLLCCFSALLLWYAAAVSDLSPRCPGCDYPIFGLRDMRCPECGRVLDVRDFNIDMEDTQGRSRRLRRDGRIGVSVGLVILLITAAFFSLPAAYFLYHGSVPPCACTFVAVAFGIWVWRVLVWIGNEARPSKKRRR